jgi:methylmalonyl-CoA/ethylmalonyl-CoA epimerase
MCSITINIRSDAKESAVKLLQVAQHADDLDRAVAFYRDTLNGELIARFDPPGLAFFALGDVRLLLERNAPSALLYLAVPDARRSIADLRRAGVEIVADAQLIHTDADGTFGEAGTEEWMGFFRDSENNLVGVASRHAPAP